MVFVRAEIVLMNCAVTKFVTKQEKSLGGFPADCSVVACGNGICELSKNIRVCPIDCTNNVCAVDGLCKTFEYSTCSDCSSPCKNNQVCERNEFTVACSDCQSSFHSFQVTVYHEWFIRLFCR